MFPYSYHDYIHAQFKFMLYQDATMTHSRFVNFDKKFSYQLLLWFIRWWTQFGSIIDIFPGPLTGSFKYFTTSYKTNPHGAKFPATLHFVKKYKVPWILKWQYVKEGDVLTRQWFVKWWDKFSHTQDVIDNVVLEFPAAAQGTVNTIAHVKTQALAYPHVQVAMPQPTTPATTSATKPAKSSAKTTNKNSAFDGLSRSDIIALLKQKQKDEEEAASANLGDEEDDQESKASSKASVANDNPYYPYNQELFGHDEASTPDLGAN